MRNILLIFCCFSVSFLFCQKHYVTDIDTSRTSTISGSTIFAKKPTNIQLGFNPTAFLDMQHTIVIGREGFANKSGQIVFAYDKSSQLRFDEHITHNDVVVKSEDAVYLLEDMICANRLGLTYSNLACIDTTTSISVKTGPAIKLSDKTNASHRLETKILLSTNMNYLAFRQNGNIVYNNRILGTSTCIANELYSMFTYMYRYDSK